MADKPILISDKSGASLLDLSRSSWWRRVNDGSLPQPIKIGGATRWRLDEVLAAIERISGAHGGSIVTVSGINKRGTTR